MGRCNAILDQGGRCHETKNSHLLHAGTKDDYLGQNKQGDSLHDIARMFDRFHSSVMPTIHQTGGYRPPVRKRHRLALSLDEREEISRGLVAKRSIRDIANRLSRAPSTISHEIKRHGGAKHYRAAKADKDAWDRALRPKPCKLIESPHIV